MPSLIAMVLAYMSDADKLCFAKGQFFRLMTMESVTGAALRVKTLDIAL